MSSTEMITLKIQCIHCKKSYLIGVKIEDLDRFNNGEPIQRAFPYLGDSDRELILSHMCDTCFDRVTGEE